jgi:endo-1,4-beta-xylanase
MLGRMENYIREVLTQTEEKFPGVIVSWDVVNEAIDDGTNWLRKGSNWTKVIGEDFVEKAFEFARKYAAEGVLLYYNDYNTSYTGKLNGIVKLMTPLAEKGIIDGYGFQMHHDTAQPSDSLITAAVDKIAGMGLKLRVSELDVGINKFTDTSLEAQARRYKFVMRLMLKYADQTEAVQVWGLTDNMSWRTGKYPLLFDSRMNPKPAFFAVAEAAKEHKGE